MVRCPSEGGHIPGDAGSNPSGTHYVCRQRSLELIGVLFRKICLLTFFSNYLFFIELFSKRDTPFLIDARRDDRTVLCYFEHNFLLNFLSCKIFLYSFFFTLNLIVLKIFFYLFDFMDFAFMDG